MRTLIIFLVTGLACSLTWNDADAQSRRHKSEQIKRLIASRRFVFSAETATPMGGGNIRLTSTYYNLTFKGDTLISFLPYFGTAFRSEYNPTDSPLSFTSSDFSYSAETGRRGAHTITARINKPQDPNLIILSVSASGYATLSVNSLNRQPISFYGIVTPISERR